MTGAVGLGDRAARDDPLARHELGHLVDEQERIAVREDRLDLLLAEHASCLEPFAQPLAAAVGVALGRPDRQAGRRGDLREAEVEGVLQRDDGGLRRRQLGEAAAELAARLRADGAR